MEFWGWEDKDLPAVKAAAEAAGVAVCGFNGDAELSLVDPSQRAAYLAYLDRSMEAARFLGAPSLTIHSNGLGENGRVLRDYQELSHTVSCALCSVDWRPVPPGGEAGRDAEPGTAECGDGPSR